MLCGGAARGRWGRFRRASAQDERQQAISVTHFSPKASNSYSLWSSGFLGREGKLIFLTFRFSIPESHLTKGVFSNFWM